MRGDVYRYEIVSVGQCDKCGQSKTHYLDSCGGLYGYKCAKEEAARALEGYKVKEG
jgi:hypothetical protein